MSVLRKSVLVLVGISLAVAGVSFVRVQSAGACSCPAVSERWDVEIAEVTVDGQPTTPPDDAYGNRKVMLQASHSSSTNPFLHASRPDGGVEYDFVASFQPR
jgi:hypothetical protein